MLQEDQSITWEAKGTVKFPFHSIESSYWGGWESILDDDTASTASKQPQPAEEDILEDDTTSTASKQPQPAEDVLEDDTASKQLLPGEDILKDDTVSAASKQPPVEDVLKVEAPTLVRIWRTLKASVLRKRSPIKPQPEEYKLEQEDYELIVCLKSGMPGESPIYTLEARLGAETDRHTTIEFRCTAVPGGGYRFREIVLEIQLLELGNVDSEYHPREHYYPTQCFRQTQFSHQNQRTFSTR